MQDTGAQPLWGMRRAKPPAKKKMEEKKCLKLKKKIVPEQKQIFFSLNRLKHMPFFFLNRTKKFIYLRLSKKFRIPFQFFFLIKGFRFEMF